MAFNKSITQRKGKNCPILGAVHAITNNFKPNFYYKKEILNKSAIFIVVKILQGFVMLKVFIKPTKGAPKVMSGMERITLSCNPLLPGDL